MAGGIAAIALLIVAGVRRCVAWSHTDSGLFGCPEPPLCSINLPFAT